MEELTNYIENGIIKEAFEAQVNLTIWNEIGDNREKLANCDSESLGLFSYLQRSAQSQMVLRTARIFDVQKRFPTRCLDSLFKKVSQLDLTTAIISNPHGLKPYLVKLDCLEMFEPAPTNAEEFIIPFIEFCKNTLIGDKFSKEITIIKTLRDKYIAHNEAISESITFDPNIVKELTDFAVNISVVIERCLLKDSIYLIEDSVERSSYFIKKLIEDHLE